jgi:hypothetical protein
MWRQLDPLACTAELHAEKRAEMCGHGRFSGLALLPWLRVTYGAQIGDS